MDEPVTVAIIEGTRRPGRESVKAARFIEQVAKTIEGVEVLFVDPADLNLPDDGDEIRDPKYSEVTAKADGFIIVAPEYNHSISGSLKRVLDSEFENYFYKSVLMVGVSSGRFAGARALEVLTSIVRTLNLYVVKADIHVPESHKAFDESGQPTDPEFEGRVRKSLTEFLWLTRTLKEGRKHRPTE